MDSNRVFFKTYLIYSIALSSIIPSQFDLRLHLLCDVFLFADFEEKKTQKKNSFNIEIN